MILIANKVFFLCDFAGDNGDRGGDERYLWSSVIYGGMCHSGGNILRTFITATYHCRHYAGYDQTVTCTCISVFLSTCLPMCLYVSLPVCISAYICLHQGGYVMPSICLSVCLSVSNFMLKLLNGSS